MVGVPKFLEKYAFAAMALGSSMSNATSARLAKTLQRISLQRHSEERAVRHLAKLWRHCGLTLTTASSHTLMAELECRATAPVTSAAPRCSHLAVRGHRRVRRRRPSDGSATWPDTHARAATCSSAHSPWSARGRGPSTFTRRRSRAATSSIGASRRRGLGTAPRSRCAAQAWAGVRLVGRRRDPAATTRPRRAGNTQATRGFLWRLRMAALACRDYYVHTQDVVRARRVSGEHRFAARRCRRCLDRAD